MNLAETGRRPKTIRKTRMCLAATSALGLCTAGCQEPQSGTNYVAVPRNENIMYTKVSPGDVPLSTGNEEYFVRNYGSADPTYSACVRDVA